MTSKIRIGLIGAGVKGTWAARAHLPAIRACKDIELVAVCTTKADSAEAARQAWDARLAAIGGGPSLQPTFETAVALHRLIDAARLSFDTRREVTFSATQRDA